MEKRSPKVYISNKAAHDYSSASKFGEFVYVTKGYQYRYSTNQHSRAWMEALKDSQPYDYILIGGMQIITCIGAALFAMRHGRLNVLLFKDYRYIPRELELTELMDAYRELEETENGDHGRQPPLHG